MKGQANVMFGSKENTKLDTFIDQEYSNKYVQGGKVGFFHRVGEKSQLNFYYIGWNLHVNQ